MVEFILKYNKILLISAIPALIFFNVNNAAAAENVNDPFENVNRNIFKFNNTLDDYFLMTKNSIPWIQKIATMIFSYPVKKYLQSLSEPLRAFKTKDQKLINRFFKN